MHPTELLLALLLAHVLGEFVFQPKKWIEAKENKGLASKTFWYHLGIHAGLLLVGTQFRLAYVPAVFLLLISHGAIDWVRLRWSTPATYKPLFIMDQILHIGMIILVVVYHHPTYHVLPTWSYTEALWLTLSIALCTYAGSAVIRVLLMGWQPESDTEGLTAAGAYIGMLERLFVFGFVLSGQWTAIGLLITAKSVFRFGDLTKSKNRKLTEYVLIGTFLSFGWSLLISLIYIWLLPYL